MRIGGHASAQQLKRVLEDTDGDNVRLLTYMDAVLGRAHIAGASAVEFLQREIAGGFCVFGRSYCLACDGSFPRVLPPDTRSVEECL